MLWQPSHSQLRTALADLYPDISDARRIATEARLPTARMDLHSSALNAWHSILEEAEKRNETENLIQTVMTEYAGNVAFSEAVLAYRAWVAAGHPGNSAPLRPLHQLPTPPADFTGRAEELEQLLQAIEQDHALVCGLFGLGGVGKTALALVLAHRLVDRYPDSQFFIDMRGIEAPNPNPSRTHVVGEGPGVRSTPLSPAQAMGYIIHAYHPEARLFEDETLLRAAYLTVLQNQRALILLDNALDSSQMEPLLPPSGCLLMVTSRQRFTLPGLHSLNLEALPKEDAVALLYAIAPRLRKHGELVHELAHLCGYLPQALRIAGRALAERENRSLPRYLDRLREARRRFPEVEASLNLSDVLLTDGLRQRWYTLAIFPGDFDAPAAAAAWGEDESAAEDALGDLLHPSLLDYVAETARYRLHDLVRAYVEARLEGNAAQKARARHAAHYERVLGAAEETYLRGGDGVLAGLALYDRERANIETGQAWAAAQAAHNAEAARLCSGYPGAGTRILELRQHPQGRIRWLNMALEPTRQLGDRQAEGVYLGNLGLAHHSLGEVRRAIEYHEQALQIDREIGERRAEGQELGNLGLCYTDLGEVHRAIEYHAQYLAIAREVSDRRAEGAALGGLGTAYADLGDVHRAVECHEQHLAIARETGDRQGEGAALGNLGLVLVALGEIARAIDDYEQSLSIARTIGDRRAEANALSGLGNAYHSLGEHTRAAEYYGQHLVIARETDDRQGEGQALGSLGLACASLGEMHRAIGYYEQHLAIAREVGDRRGEGATLGNLGLAYADLGDVHRAIEHHGQRLAIAREVGDRQGEGDTLWNMGLALDKLGERASAIARAEESLAVMEQTENPRAGQVRQQLAEWRAEGSRGRWRRFWRW